MRSDAARILFRLTLLILLTAVFGLSQRADAARPAEKDLRKKRPPSWENAVLTPYHPAPSPDLVYIIRNLDCETTAAVEAASGTEPNTAEMPTDRYGALLLSDGDMDLLARIIWLEARGEPFEGQVAVAEVVLNRVLSPDFPDTVRDVIFQPGQFTPARRIPDTEAEETQYLAAAEAADGTDCVLDADVLFFSGRPYNSRVAAVIGSHSFCRA